MAAPPSVQSAPIASAPPPSPPPGRDLDAEARAPASDVRLALSSKGVLGAWLVAGPFSSPTGKATIETTPPGVDEKALSFAHNTTLGSDRDIGGRRRPAARWTLAWGGMAATSSQDLGPENRPVDIKAALEAKESDVVGYAAGKLHVEQADKYLLLLSVDDGVRVIVDGKTVFTRDAARPVREDDDIVPLDLDAGDHDIVLKLHQRDGAWAFRARILDHAFAPPSGAYFFLPGTSADEAKALASKMSWVSLDRGFDPTTNRYRPKLTVRFPEGAPRGVPLVVTSRLDGPSGFDIVAGGVPVTAAGVGELVVALPPAAPLAQSANVDLDIAGRTMRLAFPARPQSEQALVRIDRALAKVKGDEPWLVSGSLDSVRNLEQRLIGFLGKGDGDTEAQAEEAKELERLAANLERGVDPYDGIRGVMMRRAIKSPLDDRPSELGLYIPPSYRTNGTRKYPLVVGLHGLNSLPMSMMRAIFGFDDAKRESAWKDRHPVPIPAFDAFVITPDARGNTMYRELGEDEVELAIAWMRKTFPIDDTRITITGPSMGGIGSASLPFHRPHVFAASAPLCGYHSQLIRGDIAGRQLRPWERFLLEERSNVYWAENGEHLPLYIVHGTRDLPEENSGVLIDRYEKLKYSVKHEHPDAGHNVWQMTYEDQKGLKWLVDKKLDLHPAHVRFKTTRTRYGTSAWVTIDELASESGWAEVDARVQKKTKITFTSRGVSALTFTKDEDLFDKDASITVVADGQTLEFEPNEQLTLHRGTGPWEKGPDDANRMVKRGKITGPIRDVFHEPILFVYGTEDDDARANEHVARSFASLRSGVHVAYPIMSDAEFLAKKEPLANERALFLVGRTNKLIAALEAIGGSFPVKIESGAVTVGTTRYTGKELGAAFVRPNPARPDRYVVVVAGGDVPGTLRALSLPEVLPDFIVWDEGLAPSRWHIILGGGSVKAGGFFKKDWSLPPAFAP